MLEVRRNEEQQFRELIGEIRGQNQSLEKSNDRLRAELRAIEDQMHMEMEDMQSPASNDWLLHAGDVHFCRDRTMFSSYQSLYDIYAYKIDGSKLRVLGKGTVNINWKK